MNIYVYLEPVLKNLIAELSESVEKFTKSWKMKNFFTWDFSFLTLEPSILAFAKKPIFSAQVLDRQVQGRKIPNFVYVRYQSEGTLFY